MTRPPTGEMRYRSEFCSVNQWVHSVPLPYFFCTNWFVRQLHNTNTKYNRKTEIFFHYRTEKRWTETEWGGDRHVYGMYYNQACLLSYNILNRSPTGEINAVSFWILFCESVVSQCFNAVIFCTNWYPTTNAQVKWNYDVSSEVRMGRNIGEFRDNICM